MAFCRLCFVSYSYSGPTNRNIPTLIAIAHPPCLVCCLFNSSYHITNKTSATTTPTSEAEDPLAFPNLSTRNPLSPLPKSKSKSKPSWIDETLAAASSDTRRQPWKAIVGEAVDCRVDDGQDLVRIERSVGGRADPACPFRTQGSSLAA